MKGQGSAQANDREESRDGGKARSKGQEKLKDQSGVQPKDGGEARGQGSPLAVGQGRSKQGPGTKVAGNGMYASARIMFLLLTIHILASVLKKRLVAFIVFFNHVGKGGN